MTLNPKPGGGRDIYHKRVPCLQPRRSPLTADSGHFSASSLRLLIAVKGVEGLYSVWVLRLGV